MIKRRKIGRHEYLEDARRDLSDARAFFERLIDVVNRNRKSNNLISCANNALSIAGIASLLKGEEATVRGALQCAADTLRGVFAAVLNTEAPFEINFPGGEIVQFGGPVDESHLHAGRWLKAFFLNAIVRNEAGLQELCRIDVDVLRSSSTRSPEYRYLAVEAIRAAFLNSRRAPKLITSAIHETDPQRPDVPEEWALYIDAPLLECFAWLMGRVPDFEEAFHQAVGLHRQFWSCSEERRRDPEGLISIPLTAIAVLAHDRGMPISTQSDYVPDYLVYRENPRLEDDSH